MANTRQIMTLCLATLALAAFASTSSATAQWMVNKTTLTGTETRALATTAAVDENFLLKAAGTTITCKGSSLDSVNPQIAASGEMIDLETLTFTECAANENCKVTKSIGTTLILIHVELLSPDHTRFLFLPKTKTTLATIKYEGETCALLGVQPVSGKATAAGPTGQVESTLQEIEAAVTEASNELKMGSSAAELKGKALLKLASGQTWSYL